MDIATDTTITPQQIDLMQFCNRNAYHLPFMMEPFSIGKHSYATNGHICVRVPRRTDVAVTPRAPDPKYLTGMFAGEVDYTNPAIIPELPPENRETCSECDGDGGICGDCEDCHGRGYTSADDDLSVEVSGTPFAARYIRMILALPKVNISKPFGSDDRLMLAFRFDGGDGRLMGMRRPNHVHIRNDETHERAIRETHRNECLVAIGELMAAGYLKRIDDYTFEIPEDWRHARNPDGSEVA